MKVVHRLYLTVLPAVLGVLAVTGLAYWGRYAHVVPPLLVIIAAVAAVGSLGLSWVNARYVAHRIERIAGAPAAENAPTSLKGVASALLPTHVDSPPDELDTIEGVVDHLSSAVAAAEGARTERERVFERRTREYANVMAAIAAASGRRLEEVRLPLHILLENHFGDLNENQEEMLGAARSAAEAADADLIAVRQIAELDLGLRQLRRDRLVPADLLRALLPMLQATAEQAGVVMRVDLEPLVPAITGDQPQLQEALTTLLAGAIRASSPNGELELTLTHTADEVEVALRGVGSEEESARRLLASRIVSVSGGRVAREIGRLSIRFGVRRS